MNSINEKIPFLRVLPDGWKTHRLKEISKVNLSNVDKKSHDGEKVVKLCNYVDVYYNHTISDKIDFMIATASDEQIRKLTLKKDDVILTKDSESPSDIGIPTWVKEDMPEVVCGYHLALIRPNVNVVTGLYLYYLLYSYGFKEHFWISAKGVTRFGISKGDIQNIQLLIPPIELQNKITRYLKEKDLLIDKLIKKKENLIMLLQQQRQSIITEAVTKGLNPNVKMKDSGVEWIGEIPEHWKVKKIKHFATHVGSGKTPSGGSEVYLDEGVPFLRSLNVHFDGIRLKDLAFISEDTNAEMKSSQVQPLDILLNITGASIGRTAIVPKDFGRANVNQHVCIIRLNQKKMYPYYFNMLMASDVIHQQIWFAQNGSSREGLNFVQVKELKFAMPPTIEEQREINDWVFNKLKTIYDVMSKIKEQIEKLKEYRQALIYEAVTGKIDVRDMELDEVR
ncbi:restriction endonuclease subunit S [Bacillus altitudinis]|uniref:restriction endonuclease subunit S n=1 Tax=Bacillus altitudinis TaxID=293387 RepID=UPI00045C6159|nr:restriction endonuclease subunit S [Bacillus altitudinis]KDE32111.1 Type 1 restriction-modification system (S) endonuclease subunit [Bacillus altitudinis 41KF2b]MEC1041998.1 restriction endonuclease subunit S [Bacillus altitudinis]MEC1089914.1 restriction endonuclease subunit S [Bacillus altitudinis]